MDPLLFFCPPCSACMQLACSSSSSSSSRTACRAAAKKPGCFFWRDGEQKHVQRLARAWGRRGFLRRLAAPPVVREPCSACCRSVCACGEGCCVLPVRRKHKPSKQGSFLLLLFFVFFRAGAARDTGLGGRFFSFFFFGTCPHWDGEWSRNGAIRNPCEVCCMPLFAR